MEKRTRGTVPKIPEVTKVARLLSEGKTQSQVAKITGRNPATIARIKRTHPEILEAVAERYKQRLLMEVQPSLEKITEIRDFGKVEKNQLVAAQDILDRADEHLGRGGKQRVTMVFNLPANSES